MGSTIRLGSVTMFREAMASVEFPNANAHLRVHVR